MTGEILHISRISLRIADLRKKNRVTQQELADYFSVSTDQILGLKPLDGEMYIPEKTATKNFWNQKPEYLLRTRKGYWNDDYAKFLISQIWKIDKPISVLDCGCGYGFLGLLLLPFLPTGSTYTGIDFAEDLIKEGEKLFKHKKWKQPFFAKMFLIIQPKTSMILYCYQMM